MTARDPLRNRAGQAPRAPALVARDRRWSWRALDRAADAGAAGLAAAGGEAGEPVALVLAHGPEAVILVHAAPRSGAAVAPLSPRLTPAELGVALRALEPGVVVVEEETEAAVCRAVDQVRGGGPAPRVLGVEELGLTEPRRPPASRGLAPDRPRAVLWTSGTTGRPRGVLLTGANLRASAEASRERLGLGPDDAWYASLSLAHVGGLALVTRAAWLGSRVVVRGGFDPADFLALAREGEVTHASLVPVMLRRVLEEAGGAAAPPGLRCVLLGGAATPADLLEEALGAGWPVALTYGQSEASSQVATAPPARVRRKPGAVGRPLRGVEVRIAGDTGSSPPSPEGEILVRGPTVAAGYLGGGPFPLDGEGWLRTGDRGRLDAEGDLWVTGRLDARIVSGGVNVDPAEVEAALRSLGGVRDAAVVGLPDPEWGQAVAALVVMEAGGPDAGARNAGAVEVPPDVEALHAGLRERLAGPKRPRLLRFGDALPRSVTGKVDRAAVRALLEEDRPGGPGAGPEGEGP